MSVDRRRMLAYQYKRLRVAPDMGAQPITELWPADIDVDGEWTDEQMDRIETLLNTWGT